MDESTIIAWLRAYSEPLRYQHHGEGFRAAARLADGTHLPCVFFFPAATRVDLAMRRFEETRNNGVTDCGPQ